MTPLVYIAMHIVQPPSVWRFQTHRVGVGLAHVIRVRYVPGVLAVLRFVVTIRVGRCRPRPAGPLPLRLRRQAVLPAFRKSPGSPLELRQILEERRRGVPIHVCGGDVVALLDIPLTLPRLVLHDGLPLPLRDLVNTQSERLRQRDLDVGLVRSIARCTCGAAHRKLPRRDDGELHPDRIRRLDRFAEVLGPGLLMGLRRGRVERGDRGWWGICARRARRWNRRRKVGLGDCINRRGQPEAEVAVAVARPTADPIGRAAAPRVVAPTAAATHAARACERARRIVHG